MDDRLDDRFADAVRGALMAQVRSTPDGRTAPRRTGRPPRRRRELIWAGAVAAVAVIAIVVAGLSLSGLQRRADPAEPGLRQPVQPFEGDCQAVLSEAAVADAVGAEVGLQRPDVLNGATDRLAVRVAGSLDCDWLGRGEGVDSGLVLDVASADLTGALTRSYDCYSSDARGGKEWSCAFDAVEGDTWFSGILTTDTGTTERVTEAARDRLLEALSVAAPQAASALPPRSADAWPRMRCALLGARAGLAGLLGAPGLTTSQGNGPGPVTDGQTAAVAWSHESNCSAEDDTAQDASPFLEIRALPDGAWLEEAVARRSPRQQQPAEGVHTYLERISGASVNGPDSVVLWVFDGPNALRVAGTTVTEAQVRASVTALLRTLDAAR